jgi:cysteinyl-tRNA synthetase
VRNYTDVDDKIINKANQEGVSAREIAERYIAEYDRDMAALNVETPSHTPRATEHIAEMIRLIERLMANGYGYEVDGDVYYAVSKFAPYGKLSGKDTEQLQAGARVDVDDRKRDPLDFALWKASKPGEPEWVCPWGKGRPGWHIECSAMGQHFLGETFDIHGGGADLIFPHHENEIAQAEGATGKPFVRYWIHNGFVTINQEKMSKSLKNFSTIRDILGYCHPEAVRLFLLSNHYRSPVDFSEQSLREAQQALDRLYALLKDLKEMQGEAAGAPASNAAAMEEIVRSLPEQFEKAMDDDFNSAAALGVLQRATRDLNRLIAEARQGATAGFPPKLLDEGCATFTRLGATLGILTADPAEYFKQKQDEGMKDVALSEEQIRHYIEERKAARAQKNWKRADEIRDELLGKGIVLEDGPQGTTWKVKT